MTVGDRCVHPSCKLQVPAGPGGLHKRARAAGWARRYRSTLSRDGFVCPDHRVASRPVPLERLDADALLIRLVSVPGVDRDSITPSLRPAKYNRGRHGVTWRQNDRKRIAEGNYLLTALRRAVRAAEAESAHSGAAR